MSNKDPRLKRFGLSGYNKPKRTPSHKTKSHVVLAKDGSQVKLIRFGEQGAKTAGKPKSGESSTIKRKELLSKQGMLRILRRERCLLLIGLIKRNGN